MSLVGACCCPVTLTGVFYHFCLDPTHDPSSGEGELNDTITVTDHADPSVVYWTGTTASDGTFAATFDTGDCAGATVDITATTDPGSAYAGDTVTVTMGLICGVNNVVLQVVRMGIEFAVYGCNGLPVGGVTVAITGTTDYGGSVSITPGTTAANPFTVFLPAGRYTWAATGDRWASSTGSFYFDDCVRVYVPPYTTLIPAGRPLTAGPIEIDMVPDTGYACFCGYAYPVTTTLHASLLGADVEITYDATDNTFHNAWTDGDPAAFTMDFPEADPPITCCSSGAAVSGVNGYYMTFCGFCGTTPAYIRYDGSPSGCPLTPADAAYFGESEDGVFSLSHATGGSPPCEQDAFAISGPPFVATMDLYITCSDYHGVQTWGPFVLTIME